MRYGFVVVLVSIVSACGGPSSAATTPASQPAPSTCDEISRACHDVDHGEAGLAHECHESAHGSWSEDECSARRHECLSACGASGHESHDATTTEPSSATHGDDLAHDESQE